MTDYTELRKLVEAATQGPWFAAGPSYGGTMPRYYNAVVVKTDDPLGDDDICRDTMTSEDALYIAAANPVTILFLLDRLEKAEAAMEQQKDEWLAWHAKREQLEKDAERLDWLEKHDKRYYNYDQISCVVGKGFAHGFISEEMNSTLRGAIDSAMGASK